MRIVTWNCNGAFRRKFKALAEFDADILVIQECENPSQVHDIKYQNWAQNFLWIGANKNKGVGIFAKSEVKLEKNNWDDGNTKFFLSCRVNNQFNLLGVWCHHANSPTFRYIGQLWKYLQLNKLLLGDSILAGDFNSNTRWDAWDRWWNHTDVVRELEEVDVVSLFHKLYQEEQSKESMPTYFMHRKLEKPYHIDYVFASKSLIGNACKLEIGAPQLWLEFSDHMPILVDL